MFLTIVVFLVILSVLVLVHELGHFLVAKFFGIKVEEFGFGLPPRVFGKKFGETLYSINWLPIGGFVKLFGEDEAGGGKVALPKKHSQGFVKGKSFAMKKEEVLISSSNSVIEEVTVSEEITIEKGRGKTDLNRAFFARPVWQRALVVFAGVFMNFVLAVVIISVLFSAVGVPTPGNKILITGIVNNSPAEKAGLKVGDTIESINNVKVVSPQQLVLYTKSHLGEKLSLEVKNQSAKIKTVEVMPRKVYPSNEGPMGVAVSSDVIVRKYPWYQAPFVGTKEALQETAMIAGGLVVLLSQLMFHGSVPSDVAGPVGIAQLTGQLVQIGPAAVLSFVSLLSLNLALINILPIPALDGGRLFFILIEGVFRKKVNQRFEGYAHAIGMAVLLGLILLITLHDIIRVLTGQPIIPGR
jgi:regulator of sigma E protease